MRALMRRGKARAATVEGTYIYIYIKMMKIHAGAVLNIPGAPDLAN